MENPFTKLFRCIPPVNKSVTRWVSQVTMLCALSFAPPTYAQINLTFGTYAADKPTETVKMYHPFLRHLASEMTEILGEPVTIKMKVVKEYETSIEQLANGDVDISRFGPASYITVIGRNPDISIIAIEANKGIKRFKGVIAVHADSPIQNLSELENESFAFGDELSTIGRYLAQSHLLNAGISSNELGRFEYLGRHDLVGAAVGTGRFTAGALKESTLEKLTASATPLRVIYEFENVTKPWLASSSLDPEVLAAIRTVMLSLKDAELLGTIAKYGFLEGSDTDYDIIRKAMKHSKAF